MPIVLPPIMAPENPINRMGTVHILEEPPIIPSGGDNDDPGAHEVTD